jgi:hypothetical protein
MSTPRLLLVDDLQTCPGARSRSTHTSIVCTRTGSGRVEPRFFFLIKTAHSKQTRTDAS